MRTERVVENLNAALHRLFAEDPRVLALGEDIADPYGGAFKVTKGLSTAFPDRVLATPISEAAIMGVAGGLALGGYKPIVEFMFGDFITLAFDQIVNFATKSVSMYGRPVPMNLLVRCPVGGNRGYGPTHSQCMQKHFLGIPHLDLFELNPFVDAAELLPRLVNRGHPCMLFEDKALYASPAQRAGAVDELFACELLGERRDVARVFMPEGGAPAVTMITSGGAAARCREGATRLFLEHEVEAQLLVLTQLHPLDLQPVLPMLAQSERILVVEESSGAATWGAHAALAIHRLLFGKLAAPVELVQSRDGVIPAAPHLENSVLLQADDVFRAAASGA